jgi:hypothetical protein
MTKHVTYSASQGLINITNEAINFLGKGDQLSFGYASEFDTATASGVGQTISTARAYGITIVDHSHGLTLEFVAPSQGMVVQDFQNDATGKLEFPATGPVAFASDHHGGTMASALGLSVDFQGFRNIAALEARVVHA